jgi:hypothetical protein
MILGPPLAGRAYLKMIAIQNRQKQNRFKRVYPYAHQLYRCLAVLLYDCSASLGGEMTGYDVNLGESKDQLVLSDMHII